MVRQNPDMEHLLLSSFILTGDGAVVQILVQVDGQHTEAAPNDHPGGKSVATMAAAGSS